MRGAPLSLSCSSLPRAHKQPVHCVTSTISNAIVGVSLTLVLAHVIFTSQIVFARR